MFSNITNNSKKSSILHHIREINVERKAEKRDENECVYTTKHKLRAAVAADLTTLKNDNDWVVWIFVISYFCCYFFSNDQHTNKRKQRIKVNIEREKKIRTIVK